jgi:hypothetical protein
MGTSSRQDSDFINAVVSETLLEEAIDWIQSHMSPEDVFSDTDLDDWAIGAGYTIEE